jgi:hypothetical protein
MAEHLTAPPGRDIFKEVAPAPTGILNYPDENEVKAEPTVTETVSTPVFVTDPDTGASTPKLNEEGKQVTVDKEVERSRTPEEIDDETETQAYILGREIARLSALTELTLSLGTSSYDESAIEEGLVTRAKDDTKTIHADEKEDHLKARARKIDRAKREPAEITTERLESGDLDSTVAPAYIDALTRQKKAELKFKLSRSKPSTPEKIVNKIPQAAADLASIIPYFGEKLEDKIKKLELNGQKSRLTKKIMVRAFGGIAYGMSVSERMDYLKGEANLKGLEKHKSSGIRANKRARGARRAMRNHLYSEEKIEEILEGKGKNKAETKMQEKREEKETRNKISRKGSVIKVGERKYVVKDVKSTPAQAFRFEPETNSKGETTGRRAVLGPDGTPALETIYIKEPGTTGVLVPVPRDGSYRSGAVRRSRQDGESNPYKSETGKFYYSDGTPIPPQAIGDDSFSYIDDVVVMQPLFTGEEAVEHIVKGVPTPEELKERHIMLGELCEVLDHGTDSEGNPIEAEVLKEGERVDTLKSHLVFEESVGEPDEHLSPYDASTVDSKGRPKEVSGHYRRFRYMQAETERRRKAFEHTRKISEERSLTVGRKKTTKKRAATIRGPEAVTRFDV